MSMYNMLFSNNPDYKRILKSIGLEGGGPSTNSDLVYVERFRDSFYKDGIIYIYTRLGGGNREAYKECIEKLINNKYYIKNYDDELDCTYATFEFKKPDGVAISEYWRNPFFDMEVAKQRIDDSL